MSCHAWLECDITLLDPSYEEAVRVWSMGIYEMKRDPEGRLTVWFERDDAGWSDDALDELEEELRRFPAPPDKWTAEVVYEYLDEPHEDGTKCRFEIVDGVIGRFEESRTVMVQCDPWREIRI